MFMDEMTKHQIQFAILIFLVWFVCIMLVYGVSIIATITNPITYENCQGVLDMNDTIWRCY